MSCLDAKSLMVGDWVICYHPTCKPTQTQVSAGLLFNLEQQDLGFITEESPLYRIVEPIPLTNEILAKNFIKEEYRIGGDKGKVIMLVYSDDYYDISISEYSDSIYKVVVTNNEIFNTDEVCYVSYVHQLQQFLRLCGTDKTIEL